MTKVIFLCAVLGVLSQGVHLSEAEVNNAEHVTQTKLFGDDIKSWLTPHEGVLATENTPVYSLVEKPKISVNDTGYEIIEHKDAMKNVIAYLRESKSDAITTPSNKPLKVNQKQSTVVENKIPDKPVQRKTLMEINQEISKILKINRRESNIKCQMARKATPKPYPSIVHPEILVIVDNALFKKLGSNLQDVITHILAYWNSVDLLFRNLENPKFRFNINAILIIEFPTGFPKLEYYPRRIDPDQLLLTLGKWLYRYQRAFPIDSYDMAVLMTSNQLISKTTRYRYDGISYLGGACKTLSELELVAKTISVSEAHQFYTIRNMAQELVHSLGVFNYDLNERCPMEYGSFTENDDPKYYQWSQCSLDSLTQSFTTDSLSCLYNEIYEQGTAVPRLLPGKLFEPNKHCDDLQPNTTFIMYEDNCEKFTCEYQAESDGSQSSIEYVNGLFDGASCGQGKICLHGNCVQENLLN